MSAEPELVLVVDDEPAPMRDWLPAYAEAGALALAGLAVLAPPVGLLALAFFAWLAVGQRRRDGRKYAGLRILR